MKILFENVNLKLSDGPNKFGHKLSNELIKKGHTVEILKYSSTLSEKILRKTVGFFPSLNIKYLRRIKNKIDGLDVQLSFIFSKKKYANNILRLDNINYDVKKDWKNLNKPIYASYKAADGVVFQSFFAKNVVEAFFGTRSNTYVIRNGTCLTIISNIPAITVQNYDRFDNMWICASSWRPHKRLRENVSFFLEKSAKNDCLVIAGPNIDYHINHERIFYVGNLNWEQLISYFKRATYFIHLAWLDCCPNVVIDARACGCKIICSSSGGTSEIAGKDSLIIKEKEWGFEPVELYKPPELNINDSNIIEGKVDSEINIEETADIYLKAFRSVL